MAGRPGGGARAASGDEKRVRELVAAGAKLDLRAPRDRPRVRGLAAARRYAPAARAARFRLRAARLGARRRGDGDGYTALLFESASGHARIAKLLLDGKYEGKGAAINLQGSNGDTALIWASFKGHEAVVRLLLERGADVTLRSTSGRTALYYARYHNHAAVVALLEARGAPE